jgi:hypothetical protein
MKDVLDHLARRDERRAVRLDRTNLRGGQEILHWTKVQ